jgi:tRNA uridine 5-carboxymethylaminomethyl modification enzyme
VNGQTFAQFLKRPEVSVEEIAPVLRESLANAGTGLGAWVSAMDGVSVDTKENGRASCPSQQAGRGPHSQDAPISESRPFDKLRAGYGAPSSGARLPAWVRNEMKTVETEIKYSGYLDQQRRSMEKMRRAEKRAIPGWFDYSAVSGLSSEMKQTLSRVRPQTLGQASRIAGVTPAAVSLIHVYIEIQGRARVA